MVANSRVTEDLWLSPAWRTKNQSWWMSARLMAQSIGLLASILPCKISRNTSNMAQSTWTKRSRHNRLSLRPLSRTVPCSCLRLPIVTNRLVFQSIGSTGLIFHLTMRLTLSRLPISSFLTQVPQVHCFLSANIEAKEASWDSTSFRLTSSTTRNLKAWPASSHFRKHQAKMVTVYSSVARLTWKMLPLWWLEWRTMVKLCGSRLLQTFRLTIVSPKTSAWGSPTMRRRNRSLWWFRVRWVLLEIS